MINENETRKWKQKVSSYKKLKLHVILLIQMLEDSGFKIDFTENLNGFIYIICSK